VLQGDVEDGRAQEEPERASAGGLAAGGREEVEGQRQGGGPVAGGREEGAGWRSRSRSRVWEAEDWRRDRVGKSPAFLEKRAASRVSIRGRFFGVGVPDKPVGNQNVWRNYFAFSAHNMSISDSKQTLSRARLLGMDGV